MSGMNMGGIGPGGVPTGYPGYGQVGVPGVPGMGFGGVTPQQLAAYYQQQAQALMGMGTVNQTQPSQGAANIFGRSVAKVEDIKTEEIPMDGSVKYFFDESTGHIVGKTWLSDGSVKTTVYEEQVANTENDIPELTPVEPEVTPVWDEDRVKGVEDALAKITDLINQNGSRFDTIDEVLRIINSAIHNKSSNLIVP